MGKLADIVSEQSAERRERVLATARKMIQRRGLDRVTVRALADESRVSVPTLYAFVPAVPWLRRMVRVLSPFEHKF